MIRAKSRIIVTLFVLLVVLSGCATSPKNIILCIGDGMGFEQVRAAAMYANGEEGTLCFEGFPYQTDMTTHSANAAITDSAASGTAIATGHKVNNGVLCVQIPGDGAELQTLLEHFQQDGYAVGLVTTTPITNATPAAFGAHERSRYSYDNIAADYLTQTRPNVLFGAGAHGMTPQAAEDAGYTVVNNLVELRRLNTEDVSMVSGQFGENIPYETDWSGDLPHLSQMTETALAILDNDPDGFFLMLEGGMIDWAGHDNNLANIVSETVEFEKAVQIILDWAEQRDDTLIIVTADHETGGLKVIKNNGKGKLPEVSWSSKNHTATKVPVYSWGKRAELFTGPMDNTDIHGKIIKATKQKMLAK
jgi:alkaline phosphatase